MTPPQWLDDEEQRAWRAFLTAAGLVNRSLDQQLRADAGLSHLQYEVLVRLSEAPGGMVRMTELAADLTHSKSGLSYQIGQLVDAGLVRREPCPTDVRGINAVLTDAGRERLAAIAPGHVAKAREILIDVLTPAQLTALADGLEEVTRRLQQ
ncbi:MarR family winged helix-turn-helix transcriptional regulator [Nocardia stercoris]|uniref:MarR family transcriptional regulator n=1 Tax=Nocardia stercoris TaxID=2483361 RepID=A0A3M2L7J0_9NOCA|nr:MarR family transcriptional regulator [Nocardia stercoris]RMI33652.1 MarR family transcriptional regulator [Nocardia stercoris]